MELQHSKPVASSGALRRKRKPFIVNQVSLPANLVMNLFFILCCAASLYPVLLLIGVSFTDESTLINSGYSVIPKKFSTEAYRYLFKNSADILHAYGLTIFVTVVGMILSLGCMALYAYPLSRKNFRYRKFFTFFIFFTMIFNGGMVPWYIVCTKVLNIQDTVWALILPYLVNAWHVIILRTFFSSSIPDSIIESAKMDGSGELRTFLRIVLPLSLPGLATVALFATLRYWNDWWLPMMLTTELRYTNLQYYLQRIMMNIQELTGSGAATATGTELATIPSEATRMAICVVAIGPIIFAYPFFQKYFIKGLTIGAVKG